mgnify:CR=1 FL=1
MESGNRTDDMERRIAPDGMTEDGKKESEAIDRRVEELMAPEEDDGNGRKKKKRKKRKEAGEKNTGLIKRIKGWSRRRKSLLQPVWWSLSFWPVQSLGAAARARESWWMWRL